MFRKVALLSLLCPLLCAGLAHADEGEPSRPEPPAAFSTQSARTLTKGRTAAYAGLGWPGLRVGGYLSPADAFDIGFQGQLLMGSPIMGLQLALGGEVAVPMRLRLWHGDTNDIALRIHPRFLLGRAQLLGVEGALREKLGYGGGVAGGVRVSHLFLQKITLTWGIEGSIDVGSGPEFEGSELLGSVFGVLGLESLVTRASTVFIEAQAGYGFAPDAFFDTHLALRAIVGFAHTTYR